MSSNIDKHSSFIGSILENSFGLPVDKLSIKEFGKTNNNDVYAVEFAHRTTGSLTAKPSRLFTTAIPAGTTRLVFRIPRDGVSLEDSVRIRNEIAFLSLGREALAAARLEHLVPQVYGWEDNAGPSGFRWIVEEYMEGEKLTPKHLDELDAETRQAVLDQIATVVKAFQDLRLPDSAKGFGGLTFGEDGAIKTTACVIPCGGPFDTYADFVKAMCLWQLKASERSAPLNGWRDVPQLRERIDGLLAGGLDQLLARIPEQKPTLVHADLCKWQARTSGLGCFPAQTHTNIGLKVSAICSSIMRHIV